MYLPRHFALDDADAVAAFVDAVGSAELVTFDGTRPVATLLPVIWDRTTGTHGRLLGHLARANPQWSTAEPTTQALAIVTGPQAYVSPTWYPGRQEHGRGVPTWNYVSVHLTGPLSVHDDPAWLRDVVTRLTERHERGRPRPWTPAEAPDRFIDGQLRAIVGVQLDVVSVEAKGKLSQNRDPADRDGVIRGLAEEPGPGAAAIVRLMTGDRAPGTG